MWTLITAFLLCCPTLAASTEPLKIEKLQSNPGIYFEEVGRVELYSNEWQVLIYYDLTDFNFELEKLSNCTVQATKLCAHIETYHNKLPLCTDITHQLHTITEMLKQNSQLLKSENNRFKRGLINAVGTLSKTLFGTLDSEDAATFNEHIDNLKDNQEYLLHLIKNQTLVIDTTVNVFNKTRMMIKEQFIHIEKKLNTLATIINRVRTDDLARGITVELETLVSLTTLMMIRYQSTQNLLIDLVTDVRHGKPHPSILTPIQMRQILETIQKELPNTLRLPISKNKNNLLQLYQIGNVRTAIVENRIIFHVKLPLPFKDDYQLLKLHPLPTVYNNKSIYIKPSLEYLVIDYNREHYYTLNKFELQGCQTHDLVYFLCRIMHPIFNTQSDHSLCEVDLLKHSDEVPAACEIRSVPTLDFWIQLSQPNRWLFSMHRTTMADAICGNSITPYSLTSTGIIEISIGCHLRTKDLVIQAHNIKTSVLNNHYLPSLNLTHNLPQFPKNESLISSVQVIKFHNNEDLDQISTALDLIKKNEKLNFPTNLSPHTVHHYTVSYISLAAIIIVIAITIRKKCKQRKLHTQNTQNKTKTSENEEVELRSSYQLTMKA